MNRLRTLLVATMGASTLVVYAQKGVDDGSRFGHGEDSVTCITNLVQYGDMVKQKQYKEAYEPWKVCFEQCPLCKGTTLYTDGVKIMTDLIKTDPTQKDTYYALLMRIYDQRVKYFATNKKYPASYVKGTKANDIVKYKTEKDAAARTEALALYEEALAGKPATIINSFVQNYMMLKVADFKDSKATADEVVNAYLKCVDILGKLAEGAKDDKAKGAVEDTKSNVEQFFAHSGAADCPVLEKIFTPQLGDKKSDEAWLKRVNKLLSNGDCTESDLYYATSEALHKISPEASSARGLAKMYLKQNDTQHALAYYEEAIKLEEDAKLKARYYYEMGLVTFSTGDLAGAKRCCYSATQLRGDWGDPLILLAKVYAQGAKNIGEKDYEKKAGFWVAVDKLQRAKSIDSSETVQKEAGDLIRQYSQYFPSKEDLFFEGIKDGSSYTVGGFIGESTTVRAKK